MRDALPASLGAIFLIAATGALHAHPHVFAEARLDVVVSGDGEVDSLRHVWRFDDLFSSTVLLEFDANQDLELDQAELEEVSSVVYQSLAEFDYFQIVSANGKQIAMQAPEKLVAIVSFTDESGETIVEHPASPGWPLEILSTVTFSESGGGTRVTIEWTAHDAPAAQRRTFEDGEPSMRQGWGGSLERLDEFLGE